MQRVMLINGRTCGWSELRQLVLRIADTSICGEATSPADALGLAVAAAPTAIICAGRLDGSSALPLLLRLRELCPRAILTVMDFGVEMEIIASLRHLNLAGYFIWADQSAEALQHALAAILSGEIVAGSHTVIERVIDALGSSFSTVTDSPIPLSEREQAVLRGLAAHLTCAEIARQMSLSERTVARCIEGLRGKFGAADRFALGMHARQLGLV